MSVNNISSNHSYDRSAIYEDLYSRHKYHADLKVTHAAGLIRFLVLPRFDEATRQQVRVLDVGCSHGRGVQLLWQHGFAASGVDLAPTAVAVATTHRVPPAGTDGGLGRCRGEACFKQGSAASLPFANRTFTAIMTTDMLEHVPLPLIPTVVAEFTRVATAWLFCAVSLAKETHRFAGHTLHETVENRSCTHRM